jgi:hypothetical protein
VQLNLGHVVFATNDEHAMKSDMREMCAQYEQQRRIDL